MGGLTCGAGGGRGCADLGVPGVSKTDSTSRSCFRLLARVSEYLMIEAGADSGYNGVLSANPTAPPPGRIVQWGRPQPYPLGELSEWIPTGFRAPRPPKSAVARGSGMFLDAMGGPGS